jgi:hypothetical protein
MPAHQSPWKEALCCERISSPLRLGANIPPFDEDADTAIAPALRFPLRAETAIGSRLEILR